MLNDSPFRIISEAAGGGSLSFRETAILQISSLQKQVGDPTLWTWFGCTAKNNNNI